jgi:O-antigen/teichoic acid export membrane protein
VFAKPLLQASFVVGERLIFLVPQLTTVLLVSRFWGQERFGEYALVLTWARMFQGLTNFGVTECLARDIGREPERGSSYFSHGLALVMAFSLTGMAVMATCAWLMRYPAHVTLALLVASATLLPAGILGACRGVLLARGRVEYMAGVGGLESAALLAINSYCILSGGGLVLLIVIMVGTQSFSALLSVSIVHRRITPLAGPLRRDLLRRLLRTVLPFGASTLIAFPAARFDILILSKLVSFGELGLYSAASKFFEFLFVLPLAFYMAMLPRTPHYLSAPPEDRKAGLLRPLAWYFAVLAPLAAGTAVLAEPILRLLFGSEFAAGALVLRILMLVFLFMTAEVALAMLCKAAGFQSQDLAFTAVVTACYTAGCFLLIPHLGAAGAAWAVAASVLFGVILRWRFVTRSVWPATRARESLC